METANRPGMPPYRWLTIFAGILLLLLYGGFGALAVLSRQPARQAPATATPSPTVTPTPHVLVSLPALLGAPRFDDFASGLGEWHLYYANGKAEDVDGKLVLQPNNPQQIVVAANDGFITPKKTYYVQADFRTEMTSGAYGLVFGLDRVLGTFYVFGTLVPSSHWQLWKFTQGMWAPLAEAQRQSTLGAPRGTLSAYFENGTIEAYVDGVSVLRYKDPDPFRSAGIGAYASSPGTPLFVDNVWASSEK